MNDSVNTVLEFYINGCAILATSVFGILGNFIIIVMLQWKCNSRLNPAFTSLISWLAVIDSFFLVFISLTFSLPCLSPEYKRWVFPVVLPSTLPLTSITLTASLYLVVAASIERYLQLQHPRLSNKGSFFGYVLPVLVFSAFYNIPKFFEFSTSYDPGLSAPTLKVTDFRKNVDYSYYVLGSNFIFMGLLPFTVLVLLNVNISRRLQHYFSSPDQSYDSRTMGALLYTIVAVQLVCHLPRTGLNIYEIYMALVVGEISLSSAWLVDISHLLLAVASAANVAIFAAMDLRFRGALLHDIKKVVTLYRHQLPESRSATCELQLPSHHPGQTTALLT